MAVDVDGFVAPGFEGVRDAFARNFAEHGDVGAAVAVHLDGRKVIDLCGGVADRATGRPYDPATLQVVFSTTKGATAVCAHLLADRGLLDIDAPVASYWPEFARAGKGAIPVRWLLGHKAGLPVIDRTLTLEQALAWDPVIEALEDQTPIWEPGTAHGYHALTYGWLVGEVVRRIDGRSLGTFLHEEVAVPLGIDFWIGLPASEEHRVAPLINAPVPEDPAVARLLLERAGPDSLMGRALSLQGAFDLRGTFNRPDVHAAEIGAGGGITNATSLSRLYAGLIGTVEGGPPEPLLSPGQIDAARTRQTEGPDRVLSLGGDIPVTLSFGLGFMVSSASPAFGGERAFGHTGAGGSVGFADPDHGIAFGYVINQMQQGVAGDPRTRGLIKATYEAAGVPIAFV